MSATLVKPLALVDNKAGHIMLLIDARTLTAELDSGLPCELRSDDNRFLIEIGTQPAPTLVGPFSRGEADKIRFCHRLTVAAFKDGIVTRAREVNLKVPA
jgi:hypothetical protein